jgi:hypothetical protein
MEKAFSSTPQSLIALLDLRYDATLAEPKVSFGILPSPDPTRSLQYSTTALASGLHVHYVTIWEVVHISATHSDCSDIQVCGSLAFLGLNQST